MTLEAGKELDRRCVIDWLVEVYATPSRAFSEYTYDELKTFAYDALVLLKEQEPKKIIRKQMSYEHSDVGITYYAEWSCPHCNKVLQRGFASPWLKYCFKCGNPILWD